MEQCYENNYTLRNLVVNEEGNESTEEPVSHLSRLNVVHEQYRNGIKGTLLAEYWKRAVITPFPIIHQHHVPENVVDLVDHAKEVTHEDCASRIIKPMLKYCQYYPALWQEQLNGLSGQIQMYQEIYAKQIQLMSGPNSNFYGINEEIPTHSSDTPRNLEVKEEETQLSETVKEGNEGITVRPDSNIPENLGQIASTADVGAKFQLKSGCRPKNRSGKLIIFKLVALLFASFFVCNFIGL